MEIYIELKTYKVSFLCSKCKVGFLNWNGQESKPRKSKKNPNAEGRNYHHECDECGYKKIFFNKKYPRIVRRQHDENPLYDNEEEIIDD